MSRSRKEGSTTETRSAADDVRKSFAELPYEQRISTLIKVELDMVGDAVENVVNAVSGAIDELARACEFRDEHSPATGSQAPGI